MSKVVTIELPADVLEVAQISKDEVRLESAVAFYKAKRLSLGRAAELAGLALPSFMDALADRRVGLHYGPQEVSEEARALAPHPRAPSIAEAPTVAGVDVGGPSKGFHAVTLSNGRFTPKHFKEAEAAYKWILEVKATIIAIDAPCRWAVSGRSRLAERELALHGKPIQCFKTPARTSAAGNPFYGWVFNGETLYERLSASHDLFDGSQKNGPIVFETFPHAVACALAGRVIPASPKGLIRRRSLSEQGFDVGPLANIDFVDAALCALTALQFHLGLTTAFGDSREGFIVVPRCTTKQLPLLI